MTVDGLGCQKSVDVFACSQGYQILGTHFSLSRIGAWFSWVNFLSRFSLVSSYGHRFNVRDYIGYSTSYSRRRSALQHFFLTPKLRFEITEDDKETWKETYPAELMSSSGIPEPKKKVHLLSVTVYNWGRGEAKGSKAFASFPKPLTLRRILSKTTRAYDLGWMEEFNEIEVKDYDLALGVAKFFPHERDILPRIGAVVCILFTIEGYDEAYLTSEKKVPIKIPSTTDITLSIVGSNFALKSSNFRIVLRSLEDIRIFKVTALTKFFDFLRKAKKLFNP